MHSCDWLGRIGTDHGILCDGWTPVELQRRQRSTLGTSSPAGVRIGQRGRPSARLPRRAAAHVSEGACASGAFHRSIARTPRSRRRRLSGLASDSHGSSSRRERRGSIARSFSRSRDERRVHPRTTTDASSIAGSRAIRRTVTFGRRHPRNGLELGIASICAESTWCRGWDEGARSFEIIEKCSADRACATSYRRRNR
jgi:hypothetical protein